MLHEWRLAVGLVPPDDRGETVALIMAWRLVMLEVAPCNRCDLLPGGPLVMPGGYGCDCTIL